MRTLDRLYHFLDNWVARVADALGVRLLPAQPINRLGSHPLAAYYAASGRSVVFDVPLDRLRALGANAFPCHHESNHPYVLTLKNYKNGHQQDYSESALEQFHHRCQPHNAAAYLGVDPNREGRALREMPPDMGVLPWQTESPELWQKIIERSVVQDQRKFAQGSHVRSTDWHLFGPMSAVAGQREWRRLLELYRSVDKHGYRRSPRLGGDVEGQILLDDRDGGRWCFWIFRGGQHRAGVAGALAYTSIPVRIAANRTPMIMRSHAKHWPQVVSGLFTVEAALQIFDRVVAGVQPFPWPERE